MYFIACILKCNVTQVNRCATETMAPMACVERCATNISDHTLDGACMCLLDRVTLDSPMLGRYTELTYTTHTQCMVYCIQYYDCIIESCDNICNGIEVVIFYF